MAALISDIVAATRPNGTSLDTQISTTAQTRYGVAALDTGANPWEGYFDNASDAATVNAARMTLLGTERFGYTAVASGMYLSLDASQQTVTISLTDALHGVSNKLMLLASVNVNLDDETSTFALFG